MKGDFTRYTFDPRKHYCAVLDQQGRVRTDADKLEEVGIESHLRQAALSDIVGQSGAPTDDPGFQVRNLQGVLSIGAGHYYVDGILCENEEELSFSEQTHLPGQELPSVEGQRRRFLAYLDVWRRHITAIEDPHIREVALGGPDTTTRLQTLWQVRLIEVDADAHCLSPLPQWEEVIAPPDGQLSARARPPEDLDDPCIVPPGARYTGLNNRLYRVEIRRSGGSGEATFVWDDGNGSDAFPIEEFVDGQPADRIRVGSAGRSALRTLKTLDIVEVTDDRLELAGEPGILCGIDDIEPATGIFSLDQSVDGLALDAHPKVRRWKGGGEVTIETDTFIPLENGVEVRFEGSQFRSGDHWSIPTRTATRDVEWPTQIQDDGESEPVLQPPQGIEHHYARLALLDFGDGDVEVVADCRRTFRALSLDALRILRVRTAADRQVLPLNGLIRATNLPAGLLIEFSAPLSEAVSDLLEREGQSINPIVEVQLALPEPLSPEDREFWGVERFFGFRPVILAGTISFANDQRDTILWRSDEPARLWLRRLFSRLVPPGQAQPIVDRLRCTLRVRGNFIWADGPDGTRVFLDGDTTAHPRTRLGLNLPSGDGQPGGDFYAWFWVVSDGLVVPLTLSVEVRLNVVSGVVSSGGAPIEGAAVRLRLNSGVGAGSEQTTATDDAGRFSFTALEGEYTVSVEGLGATAEENVVVQPVIVLPPGGGGGVPGGPGDLSVREINGIGEARVSLLAAHNVRTLGEFVRLSEDTIASILSVSVARAREFLADARRRIERP
jgi:Family of unknown function (DUF6519)/Carboxypeptidase regulatory-like domain